MFLYKILENPLLIQIAFLLLFIGFYIIYYRHIDKEIKSDKIKFYLYLMFLFLSIIGFIRSYYDILPFTPDSIYYLDQVYRDDFFGPNIYEYFIFFSNILFGSNIHILILINIFIYCISIKELILLIPNYSNKNFSIFFFFAFFLPSIIWFIPNILREALFTYFIIMTLKYSLLINNKKTFDSKLIFKIILFSFLSFSLRPQIFPILFIWLSFTFINKRRISILFISLTGFLISQSEYIKMEIIRKLSFHYLESFKTEAAGNLSNIAYNNLIVPENFYELIYYSPLLLFRFLFSPYPWVLSNVKYAFGYLDSIFMCLFFIIIIYKLIHGYIENYRIIIFSFMFLFALSIFEISFTGSVRHRLPFIITLFPCLVNNLNNKEYVK